MKKYLLIFFLFIFSYSYSQASKKTINALKITQKPTIDGVLDEEFWKNAEVAKDFVMFQPGDGGNERENKKTTVKVVYTNEAIYFGATLYDDKPNEIPLQFGSRDENKNVDYLQVSINPNNDGQNDSLFIVNSTGAQSDAKVDGGRKDFSWNAVWDSSVKINANSWVVEIEIPYSALRFSNNTNTWGVNFIRKLNNLNEEYSWNYIDKKIGDISQYAGEITNIKNIKPPTRLSFSPYASSSYTTFDGSSEFENSIGLDLKYGINESFTLDITLIPDFGQTAFDDQVLNLGPFEQRYSEKRAFFTEGTELFSKGRLFYSRRIGNTPVGYYDVEYGLNDDEEIINNPTSVNMLNAIKLSGRTKNGLGIGVFNAITEKTYAKIRNTTTNEIRKIVTEPLANYNVLVLDQQFNKNSSISLVNTSVLRSGEFRDANATSLVFDVADKGNKYNARGSFKISNLRENGENTSGYSAFLRLAKAYGNYQYSLGHWRSNSTYEINDLGFQSRNNYANYFGRISYRIFEPTKTFNNYKISLSGDLRYQNKPNKYSGNEFEIEAFFLTVNRFAFGGGIETGAGKQFDFNEPRVEGRFLEQNAVIESVLWFSTDYRKKFAIDVRGTYAKRYNDLDQLYAINISPRFRFSDKFEIIYSINYSKRENEIGWVNELDNEDIIFGNRDKKTITNTLSSTLNFNTKSSLALSFRHYWSPVQYKDTYFKLNEQGRLETSTYTENHDINYNIWNLDLSYSWEFAPGSQLVALYRNSIFNEDNLSHLSFNKNLDNLFNEPVTNNISLKLIYYLDYNKLKTWL